MDSVCLHSQFSRTAPLHSKENTWQGLSLLNSMKSRCSGPSLQFNFRILPQHSIHTQALVIKCDNPQNADLPRYYSKKEKKPFPIPIVELRRAARQRLKDSKNKPRGAVPPPKRGLVVEKLIPLAYRVLNARIRLINNLKKLLKVTPAYSCK